MGWVPCVPSPCGAGGSAWGHGGAAAPRYGMWGMEEGCGTWTWDMGQGNGTWDRDKDMGQGHGMCDLHMGCGTGTWDKGPGHGTPTSQTTSTPLGAEAPP